MSADIPVTRRATTVGPVSIIQAAPGLSMRHTLPLTVGACPVSANPLSGRVSVSYVSAGPVLEVVALLALLRDVERTAGAVEPIASDLAAQCSRALGVPVTVHLCADVMPGPQALEVTCAAVPR